MGLADHGGFLLFTRELVRRPRLPDAPTLFREIGIPRPTGYRLLKFYAHHGAVVSKGGSLRADRGEVVRLAGALRLDKAVPDRTITRSADPFALSRFLASHSIRHALGFQTAANRIGYFEPSPDVELYIASAHASVVHDFVVKQNQPGETRLHYGPLDHVEAMKDAEGIQVTTPVQTLLDLATTTRGTAHLDYLKRVLGLEEQRG